VESSSSGGGSAWASAAEERIFVMNSGGYHQARATKKEATHRSETFRQRVMPNVPPARSKLDDTWPKTPIPILTKNHRESLLLPCDLSSVHPHNSSAVSREIGNMLQVLRMGIAVLGVAVVTLGASAPVEAACQLIKATHSAGSKAEAAKNSQAL